MANKRTVVNKKTEPKDKVQINKLSNEEYETALFNLQVELVKLQNWVRKTGLRVIVIFEGRDAAGKGGVIKRITERVNPRVFRLVALPIPDALERTKWFAQRYISHFPAAGEIVLFDRSWYNRAGVEYVMKFCTKKEYMDFLRYTPIFENAITDSGIQLIKYWLDISIEEQERRFKRRITDPRKSWKLSAMDLESYKRWYDYSKARDNMFKATHTKNAPWYVVQADDKKRARLNCISHFLNQIPYKELPTEKVSLGKRNLQNQYDDTVSIADSLYIRERF